jgi:Na+/H+-dicarboxylate symporter
MKGLALHWQVIIGLIVGMVYAWMSVTFGWNQFTLDYITPFGDIFINLLKLIAVPLVLFSIISGVTSLGNIRKLGRMGIKTLIIYVLTTMMAVVIGLVLVNAFSPGSGADDDLLEANRIRYEFSLWMTSMFLAPRAMRPWLHNCDSKPLKRMTGSKIS